MIINESMVQMVVSMLLKQLPPGTGEKVAEFFEQNKTLIENLVSQLQRIEEYLIQLINLEKENHVETLEILKVNRELLEKIYDNGSGSGNTAPKRGTKRGDEHN